jgi:hypothetical protein
MKHEKEHAVDHDQRLIEDYLANNSISKKASREK